MRFTLIFAVLLALVGPRAARAAEDVAAIPAVAESRTHRPEVLVLGRREVLTFYATVQGYTPSDRVRGATRRARAAYLENRHPVVSVEVTPDGARVLADEHVLFIVFQGDVNALAGETPQTVAEGAAAVIRTILVELAAQDDPKEVALGSAIALGATLAWLVFLLLLARIHGWVTVRVARIVEERVRRSRAGGLENIDSSVVWVVARGVVRILLWATGLLATLAWLGAVLNAVPHARPWGARLNSMITDALGTIGAGALDALPGLLFVALILLFARLTTRLTSTFFDALRQRRQEVGWLDQDTIAPTKMVVSLLIWLFAFAMAYPYIPGSDTRAFQGVSVLFGLMVSVGASGTVGQALSGLILMFTRSYRVGEYVRIQDTEGTVVALGLFTTRVRTGMGEEVVLPNVYVLGGVTKNYSRAISGTGFVLDAVVTIGYDTPWRQVHAMLTEAASRVDGIAASPAPRVVQTALNDFYVEYRLIAYSKADAPQPRAMTISSVHATIQDVFNEYGVQIMSPHYLGDPAGAKVVPKDQWAPAPAPPLGAETKVEPS